MHDKSVLIGGKIFWDLNEDDLPSSGEGIADVMSLLPLTVASTKQLQPILKVSGSCSYRFVTITQ